jgi:hypothetical protein
MTGSPFYGGVDEKPRRKVASAGVPPYSSTVPYPVSVCVEPQLTGRNRQLAYLMLLEDPYPPFGDAPYPAAIEFVDPVGPRDRLTVAFRLILGIPHFIVLVFLQIAWTLVTIVAWFLILITGSYPDGLYAFGVGVLRWELRVEAYMFLLVDEYPPFSLG